MRVASGLKERHSYPDSTQGAIEAYLFQQYVKSSYAIYQQQWYEASLPTAVAASTPPPAKVSTCRKRKQSQITPFLILPHSSQRPISTPTHTPYYDPITPNSSCKRQHRHGHASHAYPIAIAQTASHHIYTYCNAVAGAPPNIPALGGCTDYFYRSGTPRRWVACRTPAQRDQLWLSQAAGPCELLAGKLGWRCSRRCSCPADRC